MARKTVLVWNGGRTGASRPPTDSPKPGACTTPGCGDLAPKGSERPGMARVAVRGSREPARWYCPGWCARYGQALADVRSINTKEETL